MSFRSYVCRPLNDDLLELSRPQPLVFSGLHGLVSLFVHAQRSRASQPWKLSMSELLALTPRIPTTDEARMLVFEESDGSIRQLQQLESVQGISDTRTEMLFNFQPLHVEQSSASLRVRRPSIERTYSEDLILDGGVNALEASWRWCKPHLALGGVVLRRRMA